MPAGLMPSAQLLMRAGASVREGLDGADAKNEIALRTLQHEAERLVLLRIIAIVLIILAILYACMCIEGSSLGVVGGLSHHHGRYCSECGGVV